MTTPRKCAVSYCPEPVRFVVRFRFSGKYEYCDNHGWRHAKGENVVESRQVR